MPMLVSLNGQPPRDLPVLTLTYQHASTKQVGQASIFVPWNDAACSSAFIDEDRAFPVTIYDRLGRWDGLCLTIEKGEGGYTLDCSHRAILLTARLTYRNREYKNLTAGAIAKSVIGQSLASLTGPGLRLGTFALLPQALSRYSVTGTTVAQVLTELQDTTGQEYAISGDVISWLPAVTPLYGTLLIEGSTLTAPTRTIGFTDQIAALTSATEIGQEVPVTATDVRGIWQREQLMTIEDGSRRTRALATAAAMDTLRHRAVSLRVGLRDTGAHWATLREGMAVEMLTPTAGFADQHAVWRVLSRTYTEGSSVLDLALWHLPKPTNAGIAGFGAVIPQVVKPTDTNGYNQVFELIKIRPPFAVNPGFS